VYPDADLAKAKLASGEWWLCDEPAEEVSLTCFLAPDWMGIDDMGLGQNKWVCTDMLKAETKHSSKTYSDDSY